MVFLLIAQYALIGALLSEIDRIEDEYRKPNELLAILLAIVVSFMMARLMLIDTSSAILFSAIIIGVFLAGKIDNLPFILGALIAGGALFSLLLYSNFIFLFPISVALAFSGFIDEYGHDRIRKVEGRLLKWFFMRRMTLKLGVFAVAYIGFISTEHFLGFLAFDIAYELNSARNLH